MLSEETDEALEETRARLKRLIEAEVEPDSLSSIQDEIKRYRIKERRLRLRRALNGLAGFLLVPAGFLMAAVFLSRLQVINRSLAWWAVAAFTLGVLSLAPALIAAERHLAGTARRLDVRFELEPDPAEWSVGVGGSVAIRVFIVQGRPLKSLRVMLHVPPGIDVPAGLAAEDVDFPEGGYSVVFSKMWDLMPGAPFRVLFVDLSPTEAGDHVFVFRIVSDDYMGRWSQIPVSAS
jgi:hypothetical protein